VGITVASGTGALFPTITTGDYFYATLTSTGGTQEVIKVSARVGDTMTIARGQDSTTAQSFASGSRIEMRTNVAAITDFVNNSAIDVFPDYYSLVSVKTFGATGDGATDDSDAINAGLDFVKANGGTLWFPDGTYVCKSIRLDGNTEYYSMIGGGKERVTFKHLDGSNTMFNDAGPSQIGYHIEGFTVDMQNSVYSHPNANHGFAIRQRSNVSLKNIHVTDFFECAMLIYDPDMTHLYGRNSVTDCSCDGFGIASNGFLFSNMDYCSYLRVHAKGTVNRGDDDGPGMGVQFKNNCRWGSATDIIGEGCTSGFALAGDNAGLLDGPSFITATNLRLIDCDNPLRLGNKTEHCTISNVYISQTIDSYTDAIRITDFSYGNAINNVVIQGVAPAKRAILFNNGANDNNVHIAVLDTALDAAPVVVFNTTVAGPPAEVACQYNNVRLSRALNPRLRTTYGVSRMATFDGPSDNNSFTYDNYPYWDNFEIASGIIVLENAIMEQNLIVDVEGGSTGGLTADNLDTITNHYQQTGQKIIIRTNSGLRDVTVGHLTGNIYLAGGANFTLLNNRYMLCLVWNTDYSKWVEAWRVTGV
jgi:hypothetical protein